MSSQILQYIVSFFNTEVTRKAATQFGEDNASVQKAIRAIVPVVMRGFAAKAADSKDKADQLFAMAGEATSSSWWQQLANRFPNSDTLQKGSEILDDLFGRKHTERIATEVAAETHIRPVSALGLMQWVAPLCIGALGKYSADNELDAMGLAAFLNREKAHFEAYVPPAATNTDYRPQAAVSAAPASKGKLWIPVLLLLAIAALAWYFLKGCRHENNNASQVTTTTTDTAVVKTTTDVMPQIMLNADSTVSYQLGDTVSLDLPGGISLRVPQQGAEVLLVNKIKSALADGLDTSAKGKSEGWINLYDVQFVKGIEYRKGAAEQIKNITTILAAYPSVKIKIGGYTDNTGPDAVNVRLSQQRADKVNEALTAAGSGAQLAGPEGYGPQFPVADNATPEGRAQNRRVSCRIVSVSR